MPDLYKYHIYPCGDHAITIDFGNAIDEDINRHVQRLFYSIKQKNITGVYDVIPAYSSITVVYDVIAVKKAFPENPAYNTILKIINGIIKQPVEDMVSGEENVVRVPVCYDAYLAPDLHEVAAIKNLSAETIAQLHYGKMYRVFMLGFLPGFPYMGTLTEELFMPRRNNPRTNVAAGSVGIAGKQTGIYPVESPGGWNIIGQTPLKIFDANRSDPAHVKPGNLVQFYPVTVREFNDIKAAQ